MAVPLRNLSQVTAGMITSTPNRVLRRLAIRKLALHGVRGKRRG